MKKQMYELRAFRAAVWRVAERKIAEVEASTPGEARERLLDDLKVAEFLLTPGVLEQALTKAAT